MVDGADGESILLVLKAVELESKQEHVSVIIHLHTGKENNALDHHLSHKPVTLRHVRVRTKFSKIYGYSFFILKIAKIMN